MTDKLKINSIIALVVVSIQCSGCQQKGTVPVDQYSGGTETTKSMEKTEVSLYHYVDDPDGKAQFRITSAKPLRFSITKAYFRRGTNAKGGPQDVIDLVIHPDTMKPSESVHTINFPGEEHTPEENATYLRQTMLVSVESNLWISRLEKFGLPNLFPDYYKSVMLPGIIQKDLGRIGNFRFKAFQRKIWRQYPINDSKIDVLSGPRQYSFFAYPDPFDSEPVKLIEYELWAPRFTAYMKYRDFNVSIVVSLERIVELYDISRKIIRLLDDLNIDLKKHKSSGRGF